MYMFQPVRSEEMIESVFSLNFKFLASKITSGNFIILKLVCVYAKMTLLTLKIE